MKNWIRSLAVLACAGITGTAMAKLPSPTDEEKAKAEASKQKAAQDAEVEKQKLEKAQDRVVQKYREQHQAAAPKPTGATATDPRTEVPSAAVNSRPLEKAHAYNEGVTTKDAPGAMTGAKGNAAQVEQGRSR